MTPVCPSKTSSRNAGPKVTSPKRFLQLQSVLNYNGKALITSWVKSVKLVVSCGDVGAPDSFALVSSCNPRASSTTMARR
eukprot:1159245-Pelagomonas_calceolata.AAC.2